MIFDCDGVLADSEPASVASWLAAVHSHGHPATEHEVASFIGKTERDLAEHYAPLAGVSVAEMELSARTRFLELVKGVEGFPDAARLVRAVAGVGIPHGVGSNSPRWRLSAVLGAIGLADHLPVSVAGDEVARPKPAPDVYAEVAHRLGLDPAVCVVIEDTPTGIRAARAAGASVIAVHRGLVDRASLAAADHVVASLDELVAGPVGHGA